jgi:tRNA nucleotidyltransferase (CCA-adding enzyme)
MRIYRVGGSVRDELLGLAVHDTDYVVVGATAQDMLDAGYRPVGKDFPVFLHPETHEEYALARTERKTGPGYTGFEVHFAPDVTLEEDLLRRDLTINAIAINKRGELIDPHGGQDDIAACLLRHVSPAFVEDPVRILRCARFAARFDQFSVAQETNQLMQQMVADGEADTLVAERVWQEVSRGLMEPAPIRMLEVLDQCNALTVALPGIALSDELRSALHWCAENDAALSSRVGAIALTMAMRNEPFEPLAKKLRIPKDCTDIANLALSQHKAILAAPASDAAQLLTTIERIDGLRRPERVKQLFDAVRAVQRVDIKPACDRLGDAINVASAVDAGAIARPLQKEGSRAIAQAVAQARQEAIGRLLS